LPPPWFRIRHAERRVGQALPLHLIHPSERCLRFCGPEVATVNLSLQLTVGSPSKEKPTVIRAVTVMGNRWDKEDVIREAQPGCRES